MKKLLDDARICLALLTRLPVPLPKNEDGTKFDLQTNIAQIGKAYRAAPLAVSYTHLDVYKRQKPKLYGICISYKTHNPPFR